ncbi:MAG TPA: ribonuclease HII [Candidatus Paceibacterota bacterium]|nr:ribonuclease HII [Candidatus Paceibacterota bacterium]
MRFTLGIDEAGRGPLAGPVSVGVVMVPDGFDVAREFPGVADSKKLSEKKREELFTILEARRVQGDVQFVVELESAETIDTVGIVEAVQRALTRGVAALAPDPTHIHIQLDGSLHAPKIYTQETIIHGDALIPLISLASVAAKVTRDRLMCVLAKEYPQFSFEKHKGYGTRAHYKELAAHAPCVLHRRSFLHLAPLGK